MMGSKEAVQVIRPAQLFYLYKIILQKKIDACNEIVKTVCFSNIPFRKIVRVAALS